MNKDHDVTHICIRNYILTVLALQVVLIVQHFSTLILSNNGTDTEHSCNNQDHDVIYSFPIRTTQQYN